MPGNSAALGPPWQSGARSSDPKLPVPADGHSDPSNHLRVTLGYHKEGNLTSLTDADGKMTMSTTAKGI